MREIKNYFIAFGKPFIIQTDNGGEFNNLEAKLFYEYNNIKHINSSSRSPESNGQIESQHKTLQKEIKIALATNKNFNIKDIINDCLYYYNYEKEHTSTGFKPIDLKDTNDIVIITNAIKNINKNYEGFHKEDNKKLDDDKYYLIFEKGNINNKSKIIYPPRKKGKIKNLIYSIPIEIISEDNGGLIIVKIMSNNRHYTKNSNYRINFK